MLPLTNLPVTAVLRWLVSPRAGELFDPLLIWSQQALRPEIRHARDILHHHAAAQPRQQGPRDATIAVSGYAHLARNDLRGTDTP
jgi:hypothetical protein